MDALADTTSAGGSASLEVTEFDLCFLPKSLTQQCRSLIQSYHDVHGFASLSNILWQFRLGPLIERHKELRQLLRKASTTRRAKKANEGFVEIATAILSLEILASTFAGWSAIYPAAGDTARAILQRNAYGRHMPLMDFYLFPPKQISAAALAALSPPASRVDSASPSRGRTPEPANQQPASSYTRLARDPREAFIVGAVAI